MVMKSWLDSAVEMMASHGWKLVGNRCGYGIEEFIFVNGRARKTLVRDALHEIWYRYVNWDKNK